ncbi:uncharacterized protein LOC110443432 [Mizuhopecten yessoensis]|uniref:EF-hand domain-containing protein n=1 Tax=Mizuhopecten yessoensis TaxID=6573 RepID=A0A210PEW3_MIZYE|nr:uncharacterized protein LOC110443432 [Mizuhopecten yessoensis]OWF35022.1 hypothetical protein KP79_PYT11377 [Mizuhopecten yessoensis]
MATDVQRVVPYLLLCLLVHYVTAPPPLLVELRARKEEAFKEKSTTRPDIYSNQFSVETESSVKRYSNLDQFDVKDELKFSDDFLEDSLYLDPKQDGQKDVEHDDFDKTPKETGRYLENELPETGTTRSVSDGLLLEKDPIDLDNLEEGVYVVGEFEPLSLPTNFSQYDLDGDGYINLEELKAATQAQENAALALHASDVDGDGLLSRVEFSVAPWVVGDDQIEKDSVYKTDEMDDTYDDRYNDHPHNREEMGEDERRDMYSDNT